MTEINTRKRDIKSLIANKQTTIENELDDLVVMDVLHDMYKEETK